MTRDDRSAHLTEFYDSETRDRAVRPVDPTRASRRSQFSDLLAFEKRTTVVDLGSGPGRDAIAFTGASLHVACVDLSAASVAACRAAGLIAHQASLLDLPFTDCSFEAAWTMSTIVHLDDDELDRALAEIARVVGPGAPIAIGAWAADADSSTTSVRTTSRYFRFRSDASLQSLLSRHGAIEHFETWQPVSDPNRTYQWMVLRIPG